MFHLIALSAVLCSDPILYAVFSDDKQIMVALNPEAEWISSGRLADGYSRGQRLVVKEIADEMGLCEEMESIYSDCSGAASTEEEWLGRLASSKNKCLKFNQEFQNFIKE